MVERNRLAFSSLCLLRRSFSLSFLFFILKDRRHRTSKLIHKHIQFRKVVTGQSRATRALRCTKGIKGCERLRAKGISRARFVTAANNSFDRLLLGEEAGVCDIVGRRIKVCVHIVGRGIGIRAGTGCRGRYASGGFVTISEICQLLGVFPSPRDGVLVEEGSLTPPNTLL